MRLRFSLRTDTNKYRFRFRSYPTPMGLVVRPRV